MGATSEKPGGLGSGSGMWQLRQTHQKREGMQGVRWMRKVGDRHAEGLLCALEGGGGDINISIISQ